MHMRIFFWPRWGGSSHGYHTTIRDTNVRWALKDLERELLTDDVQRAVITIHKDGAVGVETEPRGALLVRGFEGLRHWWFRLRRGILREY